MWGLYRNNELMSKRDDFIDALTDAQHAYEDHGVTHEIKLVESNSENFRKLAEAQIGKTFQDDYCSGFFGSNTYYLDGAVIKDMYENDDQNAIIVEVVKTNNQTEYGIFDDSFRNWETVYANLAQWITTER